MRVHAIWAGLLLCAGAGPADARRSAGPLDGRVRFIRDDTGAVIQLSVQQPCVYDIRFDRVR